MPTAPDAVIPPYVPTVPAAPQGVMGTGSGAAPAAPAAVIPSGSLAAPTAPTPIIGSGVVPVVPTAPESVLDLYALGSPSAPDPVMGDGPSFPEMVPGGPTGAEDYLKGRAVMHDRSQSLSDSAKATARANIGAAADGDSAALANWTGSNKITTLGTITVGTWAGSVIPISKGGTGAATAATARTALGAAAESHTHAIEEIVSLSSALDNINSSAESAYSNASSAYNFSSEIIAGNYSFQTLTVSGTSEFQGQVRAINQSASTGDAFLTRDLVDARTLPGVTIGACPRFGFLDDFIGQSPNNSYYIGAVHWLIQNGGFSNAVTISSDSLVLGGAVISSAANASEYFSTAIQGGESMSGNTAHALFALPNITSVDFLFGFSIYDRRVCLRTNSAANAGNWVLDVNGTIYPFTASVSPVVGSMGSGTRYRVALTVNSRTSISVRLDSAPYNSATWTPVLNETKTVPSMSWGWGSASVGSIIQSTHATEARSVEFDYIGLSSSRVR